MERGKLMQEQRDCSCGGSNENCCQCGGRGYFSIGRNAGSRSVQGISPMLRRKVPMPLVGPQLERNKESRGIVAPPESNGQGRIIQTTSTPPSPQIGKSVPQQTLAEARPGDSSIRGRTLPNGYIVCRGCNYAFHAKLIDKHKIGRAHV